MSTYLEKSITRIRAYAEHKGWGHTRYAFEAGLNRGSMRQMFKPDWSPNASTLAAAEGIIPRSFSPPTTQAAE